MANSWNPSANATLGLEWLVDQTPGTYVLDAASKAYAQVVPGPAATPLLQLSIFQSISAFAQAVSGPGKFGVEMYSTPLSVPPATTYDTAYPGTDTGSDFTSIWNGGNAWVTAAGAAATYTSVSPGVDDTTYLKNVNAWEAGFCRMWLRGANAAQMAGKRVLSVEIHCRLRVNSSVNAGIGMQGILRIGGNSYPGIWLQSAFNAGYSDVVLGTFTYNPATGLPWTLPDVNNIITTGGTDSFGFQAQFGALTPDAVRVSSLYLKIGWIPEDRLGYAYGDVSTTGWQTWSAKSVPNLITKQDSNLDVNTGNTGSWVANANTTVTNDSTNRGAPYTRSLKMLSGAAGTFGATSGLYPCIGGKSYSASAIANVTAGKLTTIAIQFVDMNGTTISTVTGATVSGSGAFTISPLVFNAIAPASATQMRLIIQTTATAGAQTAYAEAILLMLGSSAITLTGTTFNGGLTVPKVDGAAEQTFATAASIANGASLATTYFVLRRISGTGTMSIPTLGPGSSAVGMPQGMSSYRPALQDAAGALLSLGSPTTDVTALVPTVLHNVNAINGPDVYYTQPYAARISGQVDTTNTIKSEMTLPASTFSQIRLVVSAAVDPPQAALNIKLKRTSDNAQAGGTAIINPTDLLQIVPTGGGSATRTTPQVFLVTIPTPAANTAVQYYLEFSSGATSGQGWNIYALDDMGFTSDSVSLDTVGFPFSRFGANDGTVDAWNDPLTGGRQTRRDGMCCVMTTPAAPAGFGVVVI